MTDPVNISPLDNRVLVRWRSDPRLSRTVRGVISGFTSGSVIGLPLVRGSEPSKTSWIVRLGGPFDATGPGTPAARMAPGDA
jgi:hypothetical protein